MYTSLRLRNVHRILHLGRRRQGVLLLPGVGLDLPGIAGDGELDLADHLERLLLLLLGARAHEVRRIAVQRLELVVNVRLATHPLKKCVQRPFKSYPTYSKQIDLTEPLLW